MLKSISGGNMTITCNNCGTEFISKVDTGNKKRFLSEFNQWENHMSTPCPTCNTVEVFNMNIGENDDSEPEIDNHTDIPQVEKNQRYWVRRLMRLVRPDFDPLYYDQGTGNRSDGKPLEPTV